MDQPTTVRVSQRISNLYPIVKRLVYREALRWNQRCQWLPLDQFHRNVGLYCVRYACDAYLINSADIRVIERRRHPGLPQQARTRCFIATCRTLDHLHRNRTLQHCVGRAVYDAHAARANLRQNAIVSEGLSDHWPKSEVDVC